MKMVSPTKQPSAVIPVEKWVETTRRLLDMERKEEIEAVQLELKTLNDEENPNVLTHLHLTSFSTALFGRTLLQFAFPSQHLRRPKPHQFTVGDLVQIRLKGASGNRIGNLPTGIVARVEDTAISIALGDREDVEEEQLLAQSQHGVTIDRLVNNATFVKITTALDQLVRHDYGVGQSVVDVVFGGKPPSWQTPMPTITPFNDGMNESQLDAIRFALTSKDIALIHGPPGTGKTTTVVEFIAQAVKTFKMKVLVCAPSNIAVDNVLEKMAAVDRASGAKRLRLTRIGHPARVLASILPYCLDARIADADGTEIVQDIRKETQKMENDLKKTKEKSVRYQIRRELKANRKEIRQREQRVVKELIAQSDVVFATNVGAASKLLQDVTFDLCVIDEAAQALEASCWIPILKAKRCVLAGDHLQLPPTIKSKAAAQGGLETTLFDRLTRRDEGIVRMLTTQYRMHEDISDWSSRAMYDGRLLSAESVARRRLADLAHVSHQLYDEDDVALLNATLLLIDTAGCDLEEDTADTEAGANVLQQSRSNAGEARIVASHVEALLRTGLRPHEIAIITPYNKQVQLLKATLLATYPTLEIRSVDGFQGCEKEAVVMSLVRSNARHEVGFLADDRRMNVAITRAKRHVAVVCDTDTIRAHKFLSHMVDHFEQRGEYRSAHEYLEKDHVHGDSERVVVPARAPAPGMNEEKKVVKSSVPTNMAMMKTPKPAQNTKKMADPQTKEHTALISTVEIETQVELPSRVTEDVEQVTEEEDLEEEKPTVTAFDALALSDDSDASSDDDNGEEQGADKDTAALSASNALLRDLHASRLARQPPPAPSAPATAASKKIGGKKKKKKAKASTGSGSATTGSVVPLAQVDGDEDDDDLAFLTKQAAQSTRCSFQSVTKTQCAKSTTVLGTVCKFCKLQFCFTHGQPEVHGCGAAVRAFERSQFQSQAVKADQKPLSRDKRKLLEKKLEGKVNEQAATRSAKTKTTKKKN